ncbi:MAG: HD domain-containing protein [Candidatus Nanoarchaeia archaeon]
MKLPSEEECFKLMDCYCLPQNIREHCLLVAKVAKLIALKHLEGGNKVNIHLVYSSSLLHDLAKPIEFSEYTGLNPECEKLWKDLKKSYNNSTHSEVGYLFLKKDFPGVAQIIRKHDYMALISKDVNERPTKIEEKIVNYADKRVSHGKVVSLQQRFKEGFKRWHKEKNYDIKIAKIINEKYFELERELFFDIPLEPHEVIELID